ncbi:sialidase family protein [Parapedobacter pyrenivorans]|uniref:sialidase family protein n=1 Tax=Parapedobacter pyrenivorans TaxID=1305674 RepID=UPI00333E8201
MKKLRKMSSLVLGLAWLVLATVACQHNAASENGENVTDSLDKELVLKLAPGADNPRNSEGDFITLKDGRILFVYSRYTGESTSDHAPAYLAGRISADNGKTWTETDELIVEKEGDMNVMSVSLLRLQNGKIALFYLRKNAVTDCIPMMRISDDEAKTWSEPIACITDKQGYFVLNNDRVIQLEDGRLMMAVALHQTPNGEWKNEATLYAYYSDDDGQTWTSSEAVPNNQGVITQEPGLMELKDGRIMMYIRASGGAQQLSYSSDKGKTWSPIEKSNIPSPLSPATIKRIPETGDLLLVWNNNDGSNPAIKDKRTPLTIAVSKDEGKTWSHQQDIETDPDGWYCYIAVHFTDDGQVLLGYCAGSIAKKTHLSVTDITRLDLDEVYR